ncbi:MAG: SDR family NAD(P)-dependent oxidoreductase [Bacteroidales bacterium]|nr:SDR family NAD(P)-dependent oxidoreductase [Bacteroidales bacterium]
MKGNSDLAGKTAWITGASSGIGEALVYEFVRRGARVTASSNDPEGLERVRKACGALSEMVTCVPFDLSDTECINKIVEQQLAGGVPVDYLINIGGVSQRSLIEETPLWLDRKIFEINYFGTIAFTKAVLPYMIKRRCGHILATSSITGRFGFPFRSAYSASKQALHGFFETLYLETKKYNIQTSVIIPGRVRTNISLHALNSEGKEHGMMDSGQKNGIPPDKAARIIVKGIMKNKKEILVGGKELILLYIRKYIPWLFFRIAGKIEPM